MSSRLSRLLNYGVPMSQELKNKMAIYDADSREWSEVDRQLKKLRQRKDDMEDSLAAFLAEDEFQMILQNQQECIPTEEEMKIIHERQMGRLFSKISKQFERKITLEADLLKQKTLIEKAIAAANEAAAENKN